MARSGASRAQIGMQIAAIVIGAILSVGIASIGRARLLAAAPWAASIGIAILGMTFAGADLLGVHRWIALGPVRLNASSLACPAILIAAAARISRGRPAWAGAILLAAEIIHLLQPDAAQATALAAGGIAILAAHRSASPILRGVVSLALAAIAAATWLRADPLSAVPIVEGIVHLAGDIGIWLEGIAVVALASIPITAALAARGAPRDDELAVAIGLGITAYLAAIVLAPIAGNFPVPVMGFGVSPVLGVAMALGAVGAVRSRPPGRYSG